MRNTPTKAHGDRAPRASSAPSSGAAIDWTDEGSIDAAVLAAVPPAGFFRVDQIPDLHESHDAGVETFRARFDAINDSIARLVKCGALIRIRRNDQIAFLPSGLDHKGNVRGGNAR